MLKVAFIAVLMTLPAMADGFTPQQIITLSLNDGVYSFDVQGETTPEGGVDFADNGYNGYLPQGYTDSILAMGRNDLLPDGSYNGVQLQLFPGDIPNGGRGSIEVFDSSEQLIAIESFNYCGDPGLFCFNFYTAVDPTAPGFTSFLQNPPVGDSVIEKVNVNNGIAETTVDMTWLDGATQQVRLIVTPEPGTIFLLASIFSLIGFRWMLRRPHGR